MVMMETTPTSHHLAAVASHDGASGAVNRVSCGVDGRDHHSLVNAARMVTVEAIIPNRGAMTLTTSRNSGRWEPLRLTRTLGRL